MTTCLVCWLFLAASGSGSDVTGPSASRPATSSAPAISPSALSALIDKLDHPSFAVRDRATVELARLDPAVLDTLVASYRHTQGHEKKLRLRHVIEQMYLTRLQAGEEAFLGIRLMAVSGVVDPATGRSGDCVYVNEALKDQPAGKAGVRDGDLIVEFDGKPISWFFAAAGAAQAVAGGGGGAGAPQPAAAQVAGVSNERIERFTWHVKRRGAGATVRLRLLRCLNPGRRVQMTVGAEPAKTLDGTRLLPVSGIMLGESPLTISQVQGGLMLTDVAADSPAAAAGLKPKDVIVEATYAMPSPDGEKAGQGGIMPILDEAGWDNLCSRLKPGASLLLGVRTIHEENVTVKLGRRPVGLMNPSDMAEARAKFAGWWREKTGETSVLPRDPSSQRLLGVEPDPAPPSPTGPGVVP